MIEIRDAAIAYAAMFGAQWTQAAATMAQSREAEIAFLPFLKIRYLLDGSIILIGCLRYIARITAIGNDPADPHDNVPIDEAIMRFPEDVPRRWDYLFVVVAMNS